MQTISLMPPGLFCFLLICSYTACGLGVHTHSHTQFVQTVSVQPGKCSSVLGVGQESLGVVPGVWCVFFVFSSSQRVAAERIAGSTVGAHFVRRRV